MKNLDWGDLSHFLAVVKAGSLSAAAKDLEVNHTTVSRRISALEEQLKAPLFERASTGWMITPLGESIVPFAEQMHESVNSVNRIVTADQTELSGTLKVTAMEMFVQRVVSVGLHDFVQQYPDIDLELILGNEVLDLGSREADIAFRGTDSPSPNVIGKRLGHFAWTAYCTPELYEQYLVEPTQVCAITWRSNAKAAPDWVRHQMPELRVRYRANTLEGMYTLAKNGFGVAELPCSLGDSTPNLRRLHEVPVRKGSGLWVLSHVDLRSTARIRIFRDFMIDALENLLPLIEGRCENYWQSAPQEELIQSA